jgi:hypothetical protein
MTASLSWRDPSFLFQTEPRKGLNRTDPVLDERPSPLSRPPLSGNTQAPVVSEGSEQ